ncbi:MAG: hypothetical protein OXK80_01695 [Bdellovibrionales bacterium]|nr:hypothetical protein [Bdellovibrionales bacterium]
MESIKNLLKNIFEAVYDKIKDSAVYNTLLEKYYNLELPVQRGMKYSFTALMALLVVSLPLSILKDSLDATKEFKEKKQLIFDLIKSESNQFVVQGLNSSDFDRKVSQITERLNLSADHKVQISSYYFSKQLLPKHLRTLSYTGKQIKISGINIEEVMDIGQLLNNIDPSVKLMHLKITEIEGQENYFSATYSILHFQEPNSKTPITPGKKPA